jgi:hypothetical protein
MRLLYARLGDGPRCFGVVFDCVRATGSLFEVLPEARSRKGYGCGAGAIE